MAIPKYDEPIPEAAPETPVLAPVMEQLPVDPSMEEMEAEAFGQVMEAGDTAADGEVQVAGLLKPSMFGRAREEALTQDAPPPKTDDPASLLTHTPEGTVLRTLNESEAEKFRTLMDDPSGEPVQTVRPNLGHENWEGYGFGEVTDEFIRRIYHVFDERYATHTQKMTLEQIAARAQATGMDTAVIDLLERPPGEALNAAEMMRAIWVRANVLDMLEQAAQEGGKPLERAAALAGAVEMQFAAALAQTGRSLGAVSYAAKAGRLKPDDKLSQVPDILARFTSDGIVNLENFRAAYLSLPNDGMKGRFLDRLLKFGMKNTGRFLDNWAEAYVNALLSSPVTHAVNLASNTVFGAIQVPERALGGGIGFVRTNIFRAGGPDRVYMEESWRMLASLSRGLTAGGRAAWRAFAYEEGTFGAAGTSKIDNRVDKAISAEYWGLKPTSALGMALDAYGIATRFLGSRMLLVGDEFQKGVLYHMELEALAQRRMLASMDAGMDKDKAILEGARILSEGDARIVESAEDFAVRGTFQNDLGKITGWMQGAFSHPLMKIFVPFFKTPMNIMAETLKRSPLAVVPGTGFWTELAAGGARSDMAMSKFMMGSGLFAGTAYLATGQAVDGFKITGAGPQDKGVRDAWERLGLQPYSFAIRQENGSWKSYQYGRLAPIAGVLAMAADYAEYAQYSMDDGIDLDELMLGAGISLWEQMSQTPMLQGLFEIQELIGGEFENNEERLERAIELLAKQAGSAALSSAPGPIALGGLGVAGGGSALATVERVMNPFASNVKVSTEQWADKHRLDPLYKGWYEALNRHKSRNPLYSSDVPQKLNLWGETMKQCEDGLWCFISPVRTRDTKFNIVDAEMVSLGFGLRMPRQTQRGVKLSSEQYNEMIIGINAFGAQSMIEEMSKHIQSPYYQGLKIGEKVKELEAILASRKEGVLEAMFANDANGLAWKNQVNMWREEVGSDLRQRPDFLSQWR